MSKTITIPNYNNPFTVNINNKEYIYHGGESIEVPDEVAEAIEDALELVPKPKRYLSKIAQIAEESLKEVTEEDLEGISKIASFAFYSCKSLIKVSIPNAITAIGKNAFDWCLNLGNIYLPETPPTLEDSTAIQNIKASCVFYCKSQASLDAYKAAPNWSTLTGTYSFVVEN